MKVNVPENDPVLGGVKVTATVQETPAGTGPTQLFVDTVKFAEATTVPGFIAPLPAL